MALGGLSPLNTAVLIRHAADLFRSEPWNNYALSKTSQQTSIDVLMDKALQWVAHAQDTVGSGGIGCYEFRGWTTGYPEVTGYMIPTFWDYYRLLARGELAHRAIRMTDWELSVQHRGGGFESAYEGDGQPPIVFNTGQVIRGLLRTYDETRSEKYLDAAVRAGEWIVSNQESDGSWSKANYLGMKRVYDTFVTEPLVSLSQTANEPKYAAAAAANCEFALRHQRPNGWFDLCDNGQRFREAPSTHTICYTIDGLVETGRLLEEESFVSAGLTTANKLMYLVDASGRLSGAFNSSWRPKGQFVCLTGSAQLGVILARLYVRTHQQQYLEVCRRLLDFLAYAQRVSAVGKDRTGALPGSYPVWGRYVPLKYPSWATKFFLDFLFLMRQATEASRSEQFDVRS
ncbi:MAG: hypothetical protein M3P41_15990 [Actinomycetota bacterium]|nr:hypothetical protein [Actinomycetota bacterium]